MLILPFRFLLAPACILAKSFQVEHKIDSLGRFCRWARTGFLLVDDDNGGLHHRLCRRESWGGWTGWRWS